MIKMKKLDNKGFVLAETLVVAVFLVTVFSIIYNNMYPLIGEYERREIYDDLDSKYAVYWLKTMVQDKDYDINKGLVLGAGKSIMQNFDYSLEHEFEFNTSNDVSDDTYVRFSCDNFTGHAATQKKEMCEETLKRLEVHMNNDGKPDVFITAFKLDKFKETAMDDEDTFSDDFYDYLLYLPDFTRVRSTNLATARILAKFHKVNDDNDKDNSNNDYYTYAQIEVKKE